MSGRLLARHRKVSQSWTVKHLIEAFMTKHGSRALRPPALVKSGQTGLQHYEDFYEGDSLKATAALQRPHVMD